MNHYKGHLLSASALGCCLMPTCPVAISRVLLSQHGVKHSVKTGSNHISQLGLFLIALMEKCVFFSEAGLSGRVSYCEVMDYLRPGAIKEIALASPNYCCPCLRFINRVLVAMPARRLRTAVGPHTHTHTHTHTHKHNRMKHSELFVEMKPLSQKTGSVPSPFPTHWN